MQSGYIESGVTQLSKEQRELLSMLGTRLGALKGVKAVVLGGSHARGMAQAGSDIDLGILYSEAEPLSIESLREFAEELNDTPGPVVTGLYEWGKWVNGGAWLTIGQQRVDFLYRCLEQVERVIADAEAGRYELDYAQQPPFGFFSGTYLGEVATCLPAFDPGGWVEKLKRRVAAYPEALQRAVVQEQLWSAEFGLAAFASKFAARGDTFGTAACLTRALNQMVLALFALNRKYLVNDKTALLEISGFERAPQEFKARVQRTLAGLGESATSLGAAAESTEELLREVVALAAPLYRARYSLPK
jgi:predicted nucleotidyltransferase